MAEAVEDERRDYAILISLAMREEAEVMASALRAEGIDAFVGNAHHANVDWGYTIALGGMQVLVPRGQISEAKEAIRARIKEASDNPEGEPVQRRDRYKVWLVIGGHAALGVLGVGVSSSITLDHDRLDAAWQIEMMKSSLEWGEKLESHGCSPGDTLWYEANDQPTCVTPEPYVPDNSSRALRVPD